MDAGETDSGIIPFKSGLPTCKQSERQKVLLVVVLRMQDIQSCYLFGKRFRNRLFVGGYALDTTTQELAEYFSFFRSVIEAKVILGEYQISKCYGFVTCQSEDDVRNVTEMGTLFLSNKK